jgi:hypothetical protein
VILGRGAPLYARIRTDAAAKRGSFAACMEQKVKLDPNSYSPIPIHVIKPSTRAHPH